MRLRWRITLSLIVAGLLTWAVVMLTARRETGSAAGPQLSGPSTGPVADADHYVECQNGVVVSVSGPASEAGLEVLKEGGNAVDASIATLFALVASYPPAGNIAGGGFMIVHPAPGGEAPVVFDYRECAPAAATPTMFARDESQYTHKAVAIPCTVRGLAMAHRRFGTLPWARLLQPAIRIARDGFAIHPHLAESMNTVLADAKGFAEFQRVFGKPGGGAWKTGDRLVQPDLARSLEILASEGPESIYTGTLARDFLAEIRRGGGMITADDLAAYRAIERKPLTTRYRGLYDIYVPPAPSSGGVCLIEELNMLECFDLKKWGRWSPQTFHVLAEIMRRATCDRARYLGDPAFVTIPAKLTSPEYGRELAATIDLNRATPSASIAADIPFAQEGKSTTHVSVIDRTGMAVANTYTLERRWGSRIVVKDRGFLLNNDMWAFNLFPGVTDATGTIGTQPNTIAPGKRPLSSQTPTIVARDGRAVLVTGSPGSRAIPHTVLSVIVNMVDYEMPLKTAVDSPRFSHQWFPDQISFEAPDQYPELVATLKQMGHTVVKFGPLPQGDAHSIWSPQPKHYIGVADWRNNGSASGY